MSLEAIHYSKGNLEILDQLLLPNESKYVAVRNSDEGWKVIKQMQVRGAPAIGVVACLSLAVDLHHKDFPSIDSLASFIRERMAYLVTSRPTAVNIVDAQIKLDHHLDEWTKVEGATAETVKETVIEWMEKLQEEDIATNKAMGRHGADHILQQSNDTPVKILTHCNTGSLATAGYGTALGVVRALHERQKLEHCFCTETRPFNQGSRLTAYELVQDRLPGTLVCDDMVAMLMREKGVTAVCVGADRVVANGDTANKIGTFQIAIVAKYCGVPFYVVAPSTSIDLGHETGVEIVIEERPAEEMTKVHGYRTAPKGMNCWNPQFDVTPADLITGGIVTEFGVFRPQDLKQQLPKHLQH